MGTPGAPAGAPRGQALPQAFVALAPPPLPQGWERRPIEGGQVMYVDHRAQQLHWDPPQVAVLVPPPPPLVLAVPGSVNPLGAPGAIIQQGAKGRYKETNVTIEVRARASFLLL